MLSDNEMRIVLARDECVCSIFGIILKRKEKRKKSLFVVDGQPHARGALPPLKRPATHSVGGWMGPKSGLDGCGISRYYQDSIPGPSCP